MSPESGPQNKKSKCRSDPEKLGCGLRKSGCRACALRSSDNIKIKELERETFVIIVKY